MAKAAQQVAFLDKQGHNAVFSEPYRTARDASSTKLLAQSVRQLAKARLEKARGPASNDGPASKADDE